MAGVALLWDLAAKDNASPTFLRVASAADKAAAATARATAGVESMQAKMAAAGKSLTKGFTVPLLAIGGIAVDQAVKFNSAMTRIQTQAGGSAKDVATLSKQVLAMKGAQQGPVELANSLYHLKSVGMDNVAAMKALRASSDLAAVGHANLEETTNALAGAWRTGIKGAQSFRGAAATVNAVIGAGNMSLSDFNEALGTGFLPSAKTFGLSLKDVGAALALFTDEGVPANVAATRLRMSFSLLGAPSGKAEKALEAVGVGSADAGKRVDAMQKLLSGAGVTTSRLATDMRKPNGLLVAISDLKDHLDKSKLSASEQAALLSKAFGGGRSSSAILSMINNLDVLRQKQGQVNAGVLKYNQDVAAQKKTPAAVFARDVASLQTVAVKLGSSLLPIVTNIAKHFGTLVDGIQHLSGTQKTVLAWAAGILVGLGPLLTIGSRLATVGRGFSSFTTGIATRLATFAGATEEQVGKIGTAMNGLNAALGGAGIGLAVGQLTKNSSTGVKAIGVLGSAAAGAAVGFGAGGPLGAAIGGLAGGLTSLATNFFGAGHAAKAAVKPTDDYTQAIQQDGDAVRGATTALVAHRLEQQGLYTAGLKLGISQRTLTLAAIGNKNAINQVTAAEAGAKVALTVAVTSHKNLTKAQAANIDAVNKLNGGLGDLSQILKVNSTAARNIDAGLGKLHKTTGGVSGAVKLTASSLQELSKLKVAPVISANPKAAQQMITLITQQINNIRQSKDPKLNADSAPGRTTIAHLQSLIDALKQKTQPAINANTAPAHGMLIGAQNQINSLHGKNVNIGANTGQAQAALGDVQSQLNSIKDKKVFLTVVEQQLHGGRGVTRATGGRINGPGSATSDSIPAWLSNGEYISTAKSTAMNEAALAAGNRGARLGVLAFASGGKASKSKKPTTHSYTYGGTTRTADNSVFTDVGSAVGGLLGAANNLSSSASDISSAVAALKAAAKTAKLSNGEFQKLVGRQASQLTGYAKQRDAVNARLGTAPSAPTAYDQLAAAQQRYSDAKSGVYQGVMGSFDITTAGQSQQVYNDRPAAPTTGRSILASIKKAADQAKRFTWVLYKLKKEGLNGYLLQQLADAGPAALPQADALMHATPKQLAGINADYKSLVGSANKSGQIVASNLYGAGVKSAQGLVNGLLSKRKALNKAIENLGRAIILRLKQVMGIHSPSQVMFQHGQLVSEGFRLGIESKLGVVSRSGAKLGGAVWTGPDMDGRVASAGAHQFRFQPGPVMASEQHTHNHIEQHFHTTDFNEEALANASMRRWSAAMAR